MPIDIIGLLQFGFSATMAVLVWSAYKELVPRMLDVIQQNSAAYQALAEAVKANTHATERMSGMVTDLERRMISLEGRPAAERLRR